jgi:hypothetical protein
MFQVGATGIEKEEEEEGAASSPVCCFTVYTKTVLIKIT